jgi:hypothetical protein
MPTWVLFCISSEVLVLLFVGPACLTGKYATRSTRELHPAAGAARRKFKHLKNLQITGANNTIGLTKIKIKVNKD